MWHNKKARILIIISAVIMAIVAIRIVMNIMAQNAKARESGRAKLAVITAGYPKRQTITPKFRFSGTLDPIWQADVAAKVDGRIERVLVDEGQAVSAGQALVVLEQKDTDAELMKAQGTHDDAAAALRKAHADYNRMKYLFDKGAISQQEMDDAQLALDSAQSRLVNAKGVLDAAGSLAEGTMVTTPRAGIVQKRYYQEGYYAKVGTALFNIADITTLQAKIDVPEGYVGSIDIGNEAELSIPSMSAGKGIAVGTVTRISPVAIQPARTFEAEVSVDNRDGHLRGGVYANTTIIGREKPGALTVPLSAIVMRDDQRTVYAIENDTAVRKVLVTGYIGEDLVEVLEGLSEKDRIIVGGTNKVREGIKVRVAESEAEMNAADGTGADADKAGEAK